LEYRAGIGDRHSGAPALVNPPPPTSATELTLSGLVESEVRGVPLAGHTRVVVRVECKRPPPATCRLRVLRLRTVDKVIRDGPARAKLADTIEHTAHSERIKDGSGRGRRDPLARFCLTAGAQT
jgi:hypothetical protein